MTRLINEQQNPNQVYTWGRVWRGTWISFSK